MNQKDNAKTILKKRSKMIFNRLLREVDLEQHKHVQAMELLFLKWLRCLVLREFSLNSLLMVWDFLLSGLSEEERVSAKEETNGEFLSNLTSFAWPCCSCSGKLLAGDYMTCLKFSTKPLKLDCHQDEVHMVHRIQKFCTRSMPAGTRASRRALSQHSGARRGEVHAGLLAEPLTAIQRVPGQPHGVLLYRGVRSRGRGKSS